MSHLKERSEKKCLNCNAVIHGKYCHVCGQENLEPEESVWHLVTHFFNDITHFDGKFFSTLKYLILKPGFLSREYKAGRRASYLNPIRMYIFSSAIFFLIFFSITHETDIIKTSYSGKSADEIAKMDSITFRNFTAKMNDGKPMSREEFQQYMNKNGGIHFSNGDFQTRQEYDSLIKIGKVKDNWFERQLAFKQIEMKEKYNNDQKLISRAFVSNLLHSFPQMLFISLPLFALILKLLYFRRKEFYYTSHAIFGIHLYVFVFIMLLLIIGFQQLQHNFDWALFNYLIALVILYIFYYQYKSLRNFYQQRRVKTILKFLL